MGASIASSFLAVSQEISNKVVRELRTYGANIVVEPREGTVAVTGKSGEGSIAKEAVCYLNEQDILRIKTIFWRYNIVDFTPYLYSIVNVSVVGKEERVVMVGAWFAKSLSLAGQDKPIKTGIQSLATWWQVDGNWAKDNEEPEVMVGVSLARRLGLKISDNILLNYQGKILDARISGLVTTGGQEEEQVFASLPVAQRLVGLPGKVSQVRVSAITVPLDDFGRRDPKTMSQKELDKWICTPYVTSVAQQIEQVFSGSKAKPVWQIAETEGKILAKLKMIMLMLTVIALISAAFGVATTMTASVVERRDEIGLMKAIGAGSLQIGWLFLGEALIIGLIGGFIGYIAGTQLVRLIGILVFTTPLQGKLILLPTAVGSSLLVTIAGTFFALRRAVTVQAIAALRVGRI